MSKLLALFTSDPNLIRCELFRLDGQVPLAEGPASNAVGMGSYAQDEALLQRHSADLSIKALLGEWTGAESDAFLYHAQKLPLGMSDEDNTQPFRFRSWLFAHAGALDGFSELRTKLFSALPELLQRQVRGDTGSEAAFAFFLKGLREVMGVDDRELRAGVAARLLGEAARGLEQFATEAGATGKSSLNFVATNGQVLVATRCGPDPLYYSLLEGSEHCGRCGIDAQTPDTQPLMREHRRSRSVVVACAEWPQLCGVGSVLLGQGS